MKKTRFLSAALLVLMVLCLFSCAKKPAVYTKGGKTMLKLGEFEVKEDFYSYLFLNTIDTLNSEGGEVTVEDVKKYVLDALKPIYAVFALCDKYDVKLSDDDIAAVSEDMAAAKQQYSSEDEYKKALTANHMNEDIYEYALKLQYLEYDLYTKMTSEENFIIKVDDATLDKALEEEFVRVTHILFSTSKYETAAKLAETANSVLERVNAGEDFEALKDEFSDDEKDYKNSDGYYFLKGEFEQAFEDAAFSLKEGETSGIVVTSSGFHILKRLPLEKEYTDLHYEELRKEYATSKYYEIKEQTANSLEVNFSKKYSELTLDSFK